MSSQTKRGGHVIRGSKNMNERIELKYINLDGKLIKLKEDNLYFNNKKIQVISNNTPTSANSLGTAGDISFDNQYFYICIATNTWIRTALASW
jgi:hypothetical protein